MQPTTQKNNAKQRKTIAIVAVIAVVAIALAAVAIIAVANKREMTQAASDTCTLNAKALATHQQNFEEAQKEAEDAAKLTVDDVADGTTLETLRMRSRWPKPWKTRQHAPRTAMPATSPRRQTIFARTPTTCATSPTNSTRPPSR